MYIMMFTTYCIFFRVSKKTGSSSCKKNIGIALKIKNILQSNNPHDTQKCGSSVIFLSSKFLSLS